MFLVPQESLELEADLEEERPGDFIRLVTRGNSWKFREGYSCENRVAPGNLLGLGNLTGLGVLG